MKCHVDVKKKISIGAAFFTSEPSLLFQWFQEKQKKTLLERGCVVNLYHLKITYSRGERSIVLCVEVNSRGKLSELPLVVSSQ